MPGSNEVSDVRIAIAGAGMAGSYLNRTLNEIGGCEITLYDRPERTACGQRPCAWGMAPAEEYRRLIGRFLDPERYVLGSASTVLIDGVSVGADLLTFHKPRLIRDLIGSTPVEQARIDADEFDIVVDATGVERAYLGPVEGGDLVAELCQYRVLSEADLGAWFRTSASGYGWCFPLGGREYHIGFGNLPPHVGEGMGAIEHALEGARIRCRCLSRVRLSSPHYSRPMVRGNIVGVGESIGTVGPLGGDGNLYAMQCSELLAESLRDLDGYQEQVLRRFQWMKRERDALVKMLDGRRPSPGDVRVFIQHARRVGLTMGPAQALGLLRKVGGV